MRALSRPSTPCELLRAGDGSLPDLAYMIDQSHTIKDGRHGPILRGAGLHADEMMDELVEVFHLD
jgi:hypothetical protein